MIRQFKTFAQVGGILMVVAALGLTWHLRDAETQTVLQLAEENNIALARALRNSMRQRVLQLIQPSAADRAETLATFRADLVAQLRGLNVVKVKIYDGAGRTVFSTEEAQIGEDKSGNVGFRTALGGKVATELTFRNKFSAFDQVVENRNVLSSYIPIPARDGPVESVFEIYQDVTPILATLDEQLAFQTLAILATFVAVYILLLLVVRRADRAAEQHHVEAMNLATEAARADSASRTKSEFLANMSHELRTPLNAILGFSEMIQREILGPAGNPRYREYASDINSSATHLLEIINDILDLARIEAGRVEIHPEPVPLDALVEWVQTMIRPQAERAGVAVGTRAEPPLPAVLGNERILRQIVLNLLTNAVKFTPAGGQVTLAIAPPSDGKVAISIEDTGIGMRLEDVPRALAPFGQLDSSLARRHRGTGLGLSLANRFTALLGGELSIRSAPNQGTIVTITLPAAPRSHRVAAA